MYQIFNHTEDELLEMDNPFALVIIAAQQEAIYDDEVQDGLLNTRMKIVKALAASEKFDYEKIGAFLYFMDQLIPLTNKKLKCIFDQELTTLFGGNITMGIMEAVRAQILDEGIEKGIEKGEAIGEHNKSLEIAKNFKDLGVAIEDIAKGTGLSIKEIQAL
jgi:predicted transposase/invertase (TIGR01784 family)